MIDASERLAIALQLRYLDQTSASASLDQQIALDYFRQELLVSEQILADQDLARQLDSAAAADIYIMAERLMSERTPENYRNFAVLLGRATGAEEVISGQGMERMALGAGGGGDERISDWHARLLRENRAEPSEGPAQLYTWLRLYQTPRCSTCLETFPKASTIEAPCKHTFCTPCMRDFFLHATANESLYPPRCCGQEVPVSVADQVLTPRQLTEFRAKTVEYACRNRTYCNAPSCSAFIPPPDGGYGDVGVCPRCGARTCTTCKRAAHLSGECPNDESLARTLGLAREHGWQRCINCRAVVMKSEGCHHMTCRCGAEWCYACGGVYRNCRCDRA